MKKEPTAAREARATWNDALPAGGLIPEVLAHIASFFEKERDLINATAVCQHWRLSLLSFPRLWRNAGGSSQEILAYIERSGSTPLNVHLSHHKLWFHLTARHISRLASLNLVLDESSDLSRFFDCLQDPIPTLHTFCISASFSRSHALRFDSTSLHNPFFLHLKKLDINGTSVFHGVRTFPRLTELTWRTSNTYSMQPEEFLGTMKLFPSLKKFNITFCAPLSQNHIARDKITLSNVHEMSFFSTYNGSGRAYLPGVLEYLRLPKLTTLCTELPWTFGEYYQPPRLSSTFAVELPNFVELPEMHLEIGSCEITFRNPVRASTLKWRLESPMCKHVGRRDWDDLPFCAVQRLIVYIPPGQIFLIYAYAWVKKLFKRLMFLEYLEFRGKCNDATHSLHNRIMQEVKHTHTKIQVGCCKERGEHHWGGDVRTNPDGSGVGGSVRGSGENQDFSCTLSLLVPSQPTLLNLLHKPPHSFRRGLC